MNDGLSIRFETTVNTRNAEKAVERIPGEIKRLGSRSGLKKSFQRTIERQERIRMRKEQDNA